MESRHIMVWIATILLVLIIGLGAGYWLGHTQGEFAGFDVGFTPAGKMMMKSDSMKSNDSMQMNADSTTSMEQTVITPLEATETNPFEEADYNPFQ